MKIDSVNYTVSRQQKVYLQAAFLFLSSCPSLVVAEQFLPDLSSNDIFPAISSFVNNILAGPGGLVAGYLSIVLLPLPLHQ